MVTCDDSHGAAGVVRVHLVSRHLHATMRKYLVRQFGAQAPHALIYAVNSFLIVLLVAVTKLATRGVSSFKMILCGSFVAALGPFWICQWRARTGP